MKAFGMQLMHNAETTASGLRSRDLCSSQHGLHQAANPADPGQALLWKKTPESDISSFPPDFSFLPATASQETGPCRQGQGTSCHSAYAPDAMLLMALLQQGLVLPHSLTNTDTRP